ncbi:MAG: sugar phosphate isomerase/epimerase [Planctomycetota bacterium]|jgi:ribulose-phosphate 3-epimerase|nr:sugar phosphate isomerase/epimerase [Planctomycetota bacterium]
MQLTLGIKSDPIDRRFSFDWLFDLLAGEGVRYLQLGTFFELYFLDDDWFLSLAERARGKGVTVKSVFSSYRELGGFLTGDPGFEKAARRNWTRLVEIASLLGADFVGSSMGSPFRDRMETKEAGLRNCIRFLADMAVLAGGKGLRGITVEPMSCLAEPPTTPDECRLVMDGLAVARAAGGGAPAYFCADISHGYADADQRVVYDNFTLFNGQIPHICEFHFKNTDAIFNSTFGFGPAERERGVVKLDRFRSLLEANADRFPIEDVTGYLELSGPKIGRDYSDRKLGGMLRTSLRALREAFDI